MNKKLIALGCVFLVLLVVIIIVLANRKTGTGTVTPTGSNDQVTLIWWNLFEPQENVQPLIDAFEKDNPKIKIQYSLVGQNGIDDYYEELTGSLSDTNVVTSPDIFPIHNSWVGKFEKNLVPAPTSIIPTSTLDSFYSIVKDDFYRSQKLYGLPMSMDAIAIIYNKTKLKAKGYQSPAGTWNDFKTQALDLTQKDKSNKITYSGFSAFDPVTSEFYFDVMNQLFMQNDVLMTTSDGLKSEISEDTKAVDAFDYYQSFIKGDEATWNPAFKKDVAAFLENNLAMYPAPSWRLIDVLNYNKYYNLNLDIGVAQMPQLSGAGDYYWPTYWGMSVAKDSQYPNEAWKFIKFITEEKQLQLYDATVRQNGRPIGVLFPRLNLASENESDSYLSPYASSLAKAQNWDMKNGWELKKSLDSMFVQSPNINSIESAINESIKSLSKTPTPSSTN